MRSVPRLTMGPETHTRATPNTALRTIPNCEFCMKYPEKNRVKRKMARGSAKQQKEIAALHENVASAAAKEHGNFEDAMFDDGVSKREGIKKKEEREGDVDPERRLVAEQVGKDFFRDDREDSEESAP